ncbi:hypothetical protein [Halorarum salinum]|uniref:Uncharacterized protein n=1 Tax=Halorarum salinum TaxID=2743089 RepID=A0A7D5LC40_9EURY|nr:hypothetical protein [Halobaculum salinum]QLG63090.1 hypothetical protein HUG12_15655 [Halobaculum salinum]
MIDSPTSTVAQLHNENSYQEGEADAALDPATGAVAYKDANGDWHVRQATEGEDTKRVVREQRNPPRTSGSVGDGTAPIDDPYAAGDNVETVGFHRYDRARLRVGVNASADPTDAEVGWDTDGGITDQDAGAADPANIVGRGVELIERTDADNLLVVEFF